jgi:hypothetical protein
MFQELRSYSYQQIDNSLMQRHIAAEWFERALRQGKGKRFPANLLGRSRKLCDLAKIAGSAIQQRYAGLQRVTLSKIQGSESRTREFDVDFYPVEEYVEQRWMNIAVAYLKGETLPPVELIKFGDTYYVRDGHHRISVAHALGQAEIEAIVTVWEAA